MSDPATDWLPHEYEKTAWREAAAPLSITQMCPGDENGDSTSQKHWLLSTCASNA